MAENLIKLKANKKLLQQKLSVERGKIVTLKDISNLVARINAAEERNDLQNTSTTCKTSMVISKKFTFVN